MKGGTLLAGVAALGIGIAFGPQIVARLPAPVGNFLQRLGSDQDIVATLVTSVQKMNDLTVYGAQLLSIVKTERAGLISPLDTTTYVIVPGSVRYVVNLSSLQRDDFTWDENTSTLVVMVADPLPTLTSIDGARARVLVDGVDMTSGDERQRVLQQSLTVAGKDIATRANDPAALAAAREAGRAALQANFAAPLRAAGLKPDIIIRFRSEAAAPALLKG